MKIRMLFLLLCSVFTFSINVQAVNHITKTDTKNIMRKVADWQIKNGIKHDALDWTNAALYAGMADWAELSSIEDNYNFYWEWLYHTLGERYFQLGNRMYNADDLAVGQTNIDLFAKYNNERILWPTKSRLDWIIDNPSNTSLDFRNHTVATKDRWSWCDALFMAPPVFAKMYVLTGEDKYLEFMDKEYKATYELLYDKQEKLFFRDARFFDRKEANGKKIFWGRGNGWIVAGLVEILKALPDGNAHRKFYINLYEDMCDRLLKLQCEDGSWHASLLDPESYPSKETSVTGFILYALAYGVNSGILDKNIYVPSIMKGWNVMVNCVDEFGKLGYVQPIGDDPKKVNKEMTEVYGVGAFLLAGTEIYKMLLQE